MNVIESVIECEFQDFLRKIIGDLKVEPKFLYMIESLLNEENIPADERIGFLNIMIDIAKQNIQYTQVESVPSLVCLRGGLHASV